MTKGGLCVEVERLEASVPRGQPAHWLVGVWATGANAPATTVRLSAAPAGEKPAFSVGCGTNGTASCSLGTVKAGSTVRLLQARVTVPATATSVTSVRLTAVASASNVVARPQAAVTIAITAAGTTAVPAQVTPIGGVGASPQPVGYLPFLKGSGATLSPGGDASGLFPALSPGAGPSAQDPRAGSPVAASFPLSSGESVMDAQIAGLGVLTLAIALALLGLFFRKRPVKAPPAGSWRGRLRRVAGHLTGRSPAAPEAAAPQPDA